MFNKFKELTIRNFEGFKKYETFMKESNQEEFVKSQVPFYEAVKAFPRALCYLGYLIEDSDIRLKVAENIFEEHGNGINTNFHIKTFDQYLISISNGYEFKKNPFISDWIKSWFKDKDVFHTSLRLAAIEYLYAPISDALSNHVDTLHLYNEQTHYKKHSVLDWEHGKELLEISLQFIPSNYSMDKVFEQFTKYQEEFIDVFNGMIVFTKTRVEDIAKEKIAFYYLRENFKITNDNFVGENIISICSGGEGILDLYSINRPMDIKIIDMNKNQYNLFVSKLVGYGSTTEQNIGKFERIFYEIRSRLSERDKYNLNCGNKESNEKLKFIIDDIFSRDNLRTIFTDDAVKYTNKSFSEHFYKVFSKIDTYGFDRININNILQGSNFVYPDVSYPNNKIIKFIQKRITDGDFFEQIKFYNGKKAEAIDLSNIGDWIPTDDLKTVIKDCHSNLEKNGILVLRKLLGDYDLKKIMKDNNFHCIEYKDGFYEETIVGIKK